MNDIEQIIFYRGLENTYRHALLGQEDQALNGLENLIYLARKLSADAPVKQSVQEEVSLLRRICNTCWPTMELDIHVEPAVELEQTDCGRISAQICKVLVELISQGSQPELLHLYLDGGTLCYGLLCGGQLCTQGVISDE